MALVAKCSQHFLRTHFLTTVMQTRSVYGKCRIGNRDVVGFGKNGILGYYDDPTWPFPPVRFANNTPYVCSLRMKEMGDWKQLSCEEKKGLYRASFCQTFSEFQTWPGNWKFILGVVLFFWSFPFWMYTFMHYYVFEPLPASLSLESRQHQLRRMIDIYTNPIDGISYLWDYDKDDWKKDVGWL